jgi:hypothetical protein
MTKKHFIALADVLRMLKPAEVKYSRAFAQWKDTVQAIAEFCKLQNPNFNCDRWFAYIAGECGPNGGKVGR